MATKSNKVKTEKASKATKEKTKAKETTQTQVAQALVLDVKSNHSMRKALDSQGIDAFALHSFDKASRGYFALSLGLAQKREETVKRCKAVRLLVCNGVANWVKVCETTGDYARNGKLAVKEFETSQAVFGNVKALKELYGDSVVTLTEKELLERFEAQKEETTRTIGTGKTRFTQRGRVVLSGTKGELSLDVLAWKVGDKLVIANCESARNQYNKTHVYTTEKTTVAK
jgi:hypothetical protein